MSEILRLSDEGAFKNHVFSLHPNTLLVINFYTTWAAPCKQMETILQTIAESYPAQTPPTISFVHIDAETLPDISESYEVTAVPFLVLQRDGKVLDSVSGSDASKVRGAIEKQAGKSGNPGKAGIPPALDATPRQNGDAETTSSGASKDLSGYAPTNGDAATAPEMSSTEADKEELNKRLAELVKAAPVMLFMKGTPSSPQCGFSRQLVSILREKGVRYGFFK